jgi:hypothetical protein
MLLGHEWRWDKLRTDKCLFTRAPGKSHGGAVRQLTRELSWRHQRRFHQIHPVRMELESHLPGQAAPAWAVEVVACLVVEDLVVVGCRCRCFLGRTGPVD